MINGMHLNHPEPHPPRYPPPHRPWKNCHLQNWSIGDYQKDILLSVAKMKKKWMELFYIHTHTHTHTHTPPYQSWFCLALVFYSVPWAVICR